jgi:hypothetical protein
VEFVDKTRNIISGAEYLSNKAKMTPLQKRQTLFQKNLKRLGLILLECALLEKSKGKTEIQKRNRELMKTQVNKMNEKYGYGEDNKIQDDLYDKKKKNTLELISNLVSLNEKKLIVEDIYKLYFYSDKMKERYTHKAF